MDLLELTKAYQEPHRKYHNLSHITRMFEVATQKNLQLTEDQFLAIWYHDVVYDVGAPAESNEQRSADMLRRGFPSRPTAHAIILDTSTHRPERTGESRVVIDLDLYDLSQPEKYWTNRNLIHEEMLSVYTQSEWHEGRIAWLKSRLSRTTIFVSPFTTEENEATARALMTEELNTPSFFG